MGKTNFLKVKYPGNSTLLYFPHAHIFVIHWLPAPLRDI